MNCMQAQEVEMDQEIEEKEIATPAKLIYNEPEEKILEESAEANRQYNHVVKKLLATLSLPKTLQCFTRQTKLRASTQNPELSAQKIQSLQDEGLAQIIVGEEGKQGTLEHMLLNILEEFLPEEKRRMCQQSRESDRKLEKALQSIFSKKQKATIPIFKILDVKLDKRKVNLCEIDEKERLYLTEDNQNWIHVIDETGKLTSRKIQNCKDALIINIRWTGQYLAVLMSTHKILLYSSDLEQHKVIRLGKMYVDSFDMKFHPHPRKLAQTFARNLHGQISICKVYSGQQWEVIDKERYQYSEPLLWEVSMLRSNIKESFSREEQQFTVVNQLWHFYTLDEKMNNVLKFDSVTKKVGVVWSKKGLVVRAAKSSSCMKYLLMILATSKGFSDYYQFMKIDGHGIQMERTNLSFVSNLEVKSLKNIKFLEPEWLCCAELRDKIIYFSLKTGQLIYTHEILIQNARDGRQELIFAGPNNCLLFKDSTHLRLLVSSGLFKSTHNRDKRQVLLEVPLIESREEMVRRFSRLHGLPENLLLLLQTIRNNET